MKNLSEVDISSSEIEDSADAKSIHENLRDLIAAEAGPAGRKPLILSVRLKSSPELIGGLRGFSHWNWLYISHLWISETHRSKQLGRKLIAAAITESQNRGLTGIYVDTFNSRARDFYVRNGFVEIGKIDDFPPGKSRFYLKMAL